MRQGMSVRAWWTAMTIVVAACAGGSKQCVDDPPPRGGIVLDADSADLVARLQPSLAEGSWRYGWMYVTPDGATVPSADIQFDIGASAGGRTITRGGATVETDERGRFVSSPTASFELVQRLLLPPSSVVGASYSPDPSLPPFTAAELADAASRDAVITKLVADTSVILGARSLGAAGTLLVIKRHLRYYVLPTPRAKREAADFEAMGIFDYSPGARQQVGTSYGFFVVTPGGGTALIADASVVAAGRTLPADSRRFFSARDRIDAVVALVRLDLTGSTITDPALRAAATAALSALPADPRELIADYLPAGQLRTDGCSLCAN